MPKPTEQTLGKLDAYRRHRRWMWFFVAVALIEAGHVLGYSVSIMHVPWFQVAVFALACTMAEVARDKAKAALKD